MRARLSAILVTLLGITSPALAADMAVPRPVPAKAPYYIPAPVFTWSGPYVGVQAGYGFGSASTSTGIGTQSFHTDGFLAGSTLGYNLQSGSIVYGVEGDIAYSWINGSNGTGLPCAGCKISNTYVATVRGRVGYAPGMVMYYATGGAAIGGIRAQDTFGGDETKTKFGWTLGGGVEYAFMPRWSAKLEYLYVDFDSTSFSNGLSVRSFDNIVRAGVNYHF